MKRLLATAVITVLMGAGGAFAQTAAPSANPNASTLAVASPNANNPGAPAAGANSFTEAQAKSRIEGAGYSNVSGLIKDKDGIWKGKAAKGGTTVDVGLDYQGNVVAKNLRP
jgi:opacity protein-like surface antigen